MSLTKVVPYFRTVMTTLGHKEWKDALDDTNIPSTILNRAFHIMPTEASSLKQNQDAIEIEQAVAVKLYVKGFSNTAAGRDLAMQYQEDVIRSALTDSTRAQLYPGLKNVKFSGSNLTELSANNNDVIRVTMNFKCFIIMAS